MSHKPEGKYESNVKHDGDKSKREARLAAAKRLSRMEYLRHGDEEKGEKKPDNELCEKM